MMNCCIERRKSRESSLRGDISMADGDISMVNRQTSPSDDDDDDEFYECETDAAPKREAESSLQYGDDDDPSLCTTSLEYTDSLLYQADGRLKPCADLTLLNVNERLYVPVTQEPAPMTEDMLEEHAEVLAR